MPKHSKSVIENLVWDLWNSYESDCNEDLPEWGSYVDEKVSVENSEIVKQFVMKYTNTQEDVVEHLLRSISHWRECVHYDERELGYEIKDWTKKLWSCQGKRNSPEKIEFLRKEVNKVVDEVPPGTYFLGGDHKWSKVLSERTGVPEDDCTQILHGCQISRHDRNEVDKKYRQDRLQSFEDELKEYSIHVKV